MTMYRSLPLTVRRASVPLSLGTVALALALLAAPLLGQQSNAPGARDAPAAQSGDFRAQVLPDIDNLSQKFAALAQAMTGKYDWRPGEGVRSVAEVFNLIVMENRMLANTITGAAAPQGPRPAPITDPAQMQEALRSTYASLRQAVAALPEADLKASVRLFGRETTKQGALFMLLTDQHEHLGQSIAYARTNGVVPPWSQRPRQ